MKTLNSILTVSQDLNYADLIRENYSSRSIETFYLPFFPEVNNVIQATLPDAIILDPDETDIAMCKSLLKQVLELERANPDYAPHIFLSESASMRLQQSLSSQQAVLSIQQGIWHKERLVAFERFQAEILFVLLNLVSVMQKPSCQFSHSDLMQRANSFKREAEVIAL